MKFLTIEIKEELIEVTFLDQVSVQADTKIFYPTTLLLLANQDKKFIELNTGEHVNIQFSEINSKVKTLRLFVTGFYRPLQFRP